MSHSQLFFILILTLLLFSGCANSPINQANQEEVVNHVYTSNATNEQTADNPQTPDDSETNLKEILDEIRLGILDVYTQQANISIKKYLSATYPEHPYRTDPELTWDEELNAYATIYFSSSSCKTLLTNLQLLGLSSKSEFLSGDIVGGTMQDKDGSKINISFVFPEGNYISRIKIDRDGMPTACNDTSQNLLIPLLDECSPENPNACADGFYIELDFSEVSDSDLLEAASITVENADTGKTLTEPLLQKPSWKLIIDSPLLVSIAADKQNEQN